MRTDAARSAIMRSVKSTNTRPEMIVRSLVHRLGFRFRLHRKTLPGRPDLVFVTRRKVVFVNGCFWHGHTCKRGNRIPKANAFYWRAKIANNKARDFKVHAALAADGWDVMIVWECGVRDLELLRGRLMDFLAGPSCQQVPIGRLRSIDEVDPGEGAQNRVIEFPDRMVSDICWKATAIDR
jgi:DNA mismatch endonuclease (patch repair protein)